MPNIAHREFNCVIAALSALALTLISGCAASAPQDTKVPTPSTLKTDLDKLHNLRAAYRLDEAQAAAERLEPVYRKSSPDLYANFMLGVCSTCDGLFDCYPYANGTTQDHFAAMALQNHPDLSPEQRFKLALLLHPGIPLGQKTDAWTDQEKLAQLRAAWRDVNAEIDPNFDMNHPPPRYPDVPGPSIAGGDPASISDPVVRKNYIQAMEAIHQKSLIFLKQWSLRDITQTYQRHVVSFSTTYIRRSNLTPDQAAHLLRQIPLDPDTTAKILHALQSPA